MIDFHRQRKTLSIIIFSLGIYLSLLPGCNHGEWTGNKRPHPVNKITGIYTDLYFNREGGDLLGWEFFILNSDSGYYVLYQESIGEPVSLELIPLQVKGDQFCFSLPETGSISGTFSGRITASGLSGKTTQGYELSLNRKQSYWGGTTPSPKKTGLYSNMHDDGNGGVTGLEIFIVIHSGTYLALIQESNGIPNTPFLVPIEFEGSSFSFPVPGKGAEESFFSGQISSEGLSGKFTGKEIIFLKRNNSYWQ